ncbi:hypothetical protein JCM10212_006045 [Sporobolomyces blumeae]
MPSRPSPAPAGWPANVVYLSTPAPSRLLPAAHRETYCSPCPPHLLPNPSPKLAIRRITDPSHPACGQSGLFNASGKKIERGTWLRDYVGVVHLEREADPKSDYDLSLDRIPSRSGSDGVETSQEVIGIDATTQGGEARFVNDYRGTGLPRPNALFEVREWDLGSGKGKAKRMAIWAGPHGIDKNAEVCVSYGKGFWDHRKNES